MAKHDGSGGYWRGGKWIAITWGHKISGALRSPESKALKQMTCLNCGKQMMRRSNTKWCSQECSYHGAKRFANQWDRKAITSGAGLRLGPGKRQMVSDLFRGAIDKPCTYCGAVVTMDNAHIDHKTPITGIRGTPLGATLDRLDNLQVICRKCNIAKSNLTDVKFRKLLAFLRSDPELYGVVWRRLGMQGHGWSALKRRGYHGGARRQ